LRIRITAVLALVAGAGVAGATYAQSAADYPNKPIRIVVPQSAGASTDITARVIAKGLSEPFRQTLVVDNRSPFNGTEIVAQSPPDGYTILIVASSFAINNSLYPKLPYDAIRDFTPITQLSKFPNMLVAHPTLPVKSLQDVIAMAKAKPGQLNWASAGSGTGTHMSGELLKQMAGIDITHIPYKGGGPAITAVIGAQVQLMIGASIGLIPHVKAGRLKPIGVTSPKRSPAVPDVPTFAESGLPGYDHEPWNGMFGPAKMPRAIAAKLQQETAKVLQLPDVTRVFANDAAEAVGNTPEQFAAIVKSEYFKWAKVIKTAGVKPD
jgi:tripartite-type tricarboxylate transporter receptor subunit TctC